MGFIDTITTEELRAGLQQARRTLFIGEDRGKSPEWIAEVKAVIAGLCKELRKRGEEVEE